MLSYGYPIGGDLSSTSLMIPDALDKIVLSPSKSKFIVIGTINEILEWMNLNKNIVCEYEDNDNKRVKNHHNKNNDSLKTKKLVTFNKPKKSSARILFELYAFTKQQQQQQQHHHHHHHFHHNLSLCKKIFSLNKVDKISNFPSSLSSTTVFRLVIKFENIYNHRDNIIIEEGNDEKNERDERDERDEGYMLIKRSKCMVGVTLMQVLNVWTRNLENHQHKKDIERARLDSDFDY